MKLLPLILSVSYVQSKESTIECADCYFSYVEVNGYITPMKGDQNCMTNPKIMPTKQHPSEGTEFRPFLVPNSITKRTKMCQNVRNLIQVMFMV